MKDIISLFDRVKNFLSCEMSTPYRETRVNKLRKIIWRNSNHSGQPIDNVLWVPIEKVQANDYNPNSVAKIEMRLLYTSIKHDGYTQPIVTIYDKELKKYIIVDGFHRYLVMKSNKDIYDLNRGLLPVVVIDKDVNDRMASTIRHNRARGKHSIDGMSSIVFEMLNNNWKDEDICNELGMEGEELHRLKHLTGFSKLFENKEYNKSWETKGQILLRKEHSHGSFENKSGQDKAVPSKPKKKR